MENGKPLETQKHWYLVMWESDKQRGCTEVPCALPWAAGDMMLVTAYLHTRNPQAGLITITGVTPILPPRAPVEETAKPENAETAAPVESRYDVWIAGKLARSGVSEEAAWDMVEKRHWADSYELLDSKTGISLAKG